MRLKVLSCALAALILTHAVPADAAMRYETLAKHCSRKSDFCRGLFIGLLEGKEIYFERVQDLAERTPTLGPKVANQLSIESWCFPAEYEEVAKRSMAEFADRVQEDIMTFLQREIEAAEGWNKGQYAVNMVGQNLLRAAMSKAYNCSKPRDAIWWAEPVW
ncbi:hypothetical protein [Lysobacter sp. N42]|uniref:hypothetical protein n=1 Tax=Lysobacter sp. N42 TaxID=2545719 RepID=UPI001044477E|nr:hypothetical protein [Lysobacter sp. N42]TCZ77320.1 hypothetical protein EYQ95_26075 [Lysobacter sp. N42]